MYKASLPLPADLEDHVLRDVIRMIKQEHGTAVIVWSAPCAEGNRHLHFERSNVRCPVKFKATHDSIVQIVTQLVPTTT